jgi:hypothetical protein
MVHALRKEEKNWYSFGQLIDDARVVRNSLHNWKLKVSHVKKKASEVAHRLANETLSIMDE